METVGTIPNGRNNIPLVMARTTPTASSVVLPTAHYQASGQMPLKNQPCAYCGSKEHPRTKGHVISRNLFHEFLPDDTQRITVPECVECKAAWEVAETHFRNVFVLIWDSVNLQDDRRLANMRRSFQQPDGPRRWRDLVNQIATANTPNGKREAIYPTKDPFCCMIFRRIVRGLSHHHHLGSPIQDHLVEVGPLPYELPEAFEEEMTWHQLAPDFFKYGFCQIDDDGIRSFWAMIFSKHIRLFGIVSQEAKEGCFEWGHDN